MIPVAGAINFRDVGGLPAGAGVTRDGVLFRSGNLARLAVEGREQLTALGLRRIVDLRADDEVTRDPSLVEGLGIQTIRAPLFLGSASSFFVADMTLAQMYRSMVDDASARIVEVVRAVVDDQPVLVHCTVGKDRTGVTVALTLAAAGVDEEAVISDYARTEALLPRDRNEQVVARLRQAHPEALNLEELATRSPAEVMSGLLEDLRARFGGPSDYLRAHGFADDELRELRRVLVTS